jgi:hypothetical protein
VLDLKRPGDVAIVARELTPAVNASDFVPGPIDRCGAPVHLTAKCVALGYAFEWRTAPRCVYCAFPPDTERDNYPEHVRPSVIIIDEVLICRHRRVAAKRGRSIKRPGRFTRSPHVTESDRRIVTAALNRVAAGTDLVAVTARCYLAGDWSAVDSHQDQTRWIAKENGDRRTLRQVPLSELEARNVWRIICQTRMFRHVTKACRETEDAREVGVIQ